MIYITDSLYKAMRRTIKAYQKLVESPKEVHHKWLFWMTKKSCALCDAVGYGKADTPNCIRCPLGPKPYGCVGGKYGAPTYRDLRVSLRSGKQAAIRKAARLRLAWIRKRFAKCPGWRSRARS